jgi:hypothetical protein
MYTSIIPQLIGSEVLTETGARLGWLRHFRTDSVTHAHYLVLSPVKRPLYFSWLRSRYEISAELVTYANRSRVLLREGAEEEILNLRVGLIEKIGFGNLPWQHKTQELIFWAVADSGNSDDDLGAQPSTPKSPSPNTGGSSTGLP